MAKTKTKGKKKKKGGLPAKYAKMGFKEGWKAYKATSAYKKKHRKTKTKTKRKYKTKRKTTKRRKTKRRTTRVATGLNAMAQKGARKLRAKKDIMKSNYNSSKGRMKSNYGRLPFGPRTKRAYNAGINAAKYTAPNATKWERNWKAGVRR